MEDDDVPGSLGRELSHEVALARPNPAKILLALDLARPKLRAL